MKKKQKRQDGRFTRERVEIVCPECDGHGVHDIVGICPRCNGAGKIVVWKIRRRKGGER